MMERMIPLETIAEPPASELTPHSLLAVAADVVVTGDVPTTGPNGETIEPWERGVTFTPEGCVEALAWADDCDVNVDRTKPNIVGPGEPPAILPFHVYAGVRCTASGMGEEFYMGRVRRMFEPAIAKAVEREFWTGSTNRGQSLQFSTPLANILNPTPGTAVSLAEGLVLGAQALANCGPGARGMVHLSAGAGERTVQKGYAKPAEGTDDDYEGELVNGRGDLVVIGNGYPGWGPIEWDGEDPRPVPGEGADVPTGNETWIYFTGMVAAESGAPMIVPDNLSDALDRQRNTVEFYGEATAIAFHDGCCSFAVLVDLFASEG